MDEVNAKCRDCLQRMDAGDRQALRSLYDLTLGNCYGLALRIVRDAGIAEDVVAETYMQVWQQVSRFDPARGTPLAWILTICRSRALDALRRADPADTHPDPATLVIEVSAHDDPGALIEALGDSEALREALAALPDEPRQIIGLAFYRGLSHQEIADHTGLPLGTVKSHLRRGQERLRHHLEDRPRSTGVLN